MMALLNRMKGACYALLFYLLGQERERRKNTEHALQLQQAYMAVDENNKVYRDTGKSGLLKRLRNKTND